MVVVLLPFFLPMYDGEFGHGGGSGIGGGLAAGAATAVVAVVAVVAVDNNWRQKRPASRGSTVA